MITREQVSMAYRLVLGRDPENEAVVQSQMASSTVGDLVAAMMQSDEFMLHHIPDRAKQGRLTPNDQEVELGTVLLRGVRPDAEAIETAATLGNYRTWLLHLLDAKRPSEPIRTVAAARSVSPVQRATAHDRHRGTEYLAPRDLRNLTSEPRRVVLIGGCVFDGWGEVLQASHGAVTVDRVLFNHAASLPHVEPDYLANCDFQLIQVPLRSVLPEAEYLRLSYDDPDGHKAMFDRCVDRLSLFLDEAGAWSSQVATFVMNYQTPQANMLGRFAPRYDLRNPIYFIEELNRALYGIVDARANCNMLDLDQISGTFGRRLAQDDAVWLFNHGGTISDFDAALDRERMEPVPALSEHHDYDVAGFIETVWGEATAMWRTLKGIDSVKMVCVDLDDTLWRGVAAERQAFDGDMVEGWPLGVIEALAYLKKRGVILTIVSKNDPNRVAEMWNILIGSRMRLEDFAIRKIGWSPKSDTIREALAEANIMPDAAIFLDDNPIERASVTAAIPGIRTVGGSHYYWRRILLWSSETQGVAITHESANRNTMIGAQVNREIARAKISRPEFLASLGLRIDLHAIVSPEDPRFARAFELVNKTNQFNTTGRRWSLVEATAYLAEGGTWIVTEATDSFVGYGLIAVVLVRDRQIDQFVMSCRVVGLEVEIATLAKLGELIGSDTCAPWHATMIDTAANRLSRDLFARIGWTGAGGVWQGTRLPSMPLHIVTG